MEIKETKPYAQWLANKAELFTEDEEKFVKAFMSELSNDANSWKKDDFETVAKLFLKEVGTKYGLEVVVHLNDAAYQSDKKDPKVHVNFDSNAIMEKDNKAEEFVNSLRTCTEKITGRNIKNIITGVTGSSGPKAIISAKYLGALIADNAKAPADKSVLVPVYFTYMIDDAKDTMVELVANEDQPWEEKFVNKVNAIAAEPAKKNYTGTRSKFDEVSNRAMLSYNIKSKDFTKIPFLKNVMVNYKPVDLDKLEKFAKKSAENRAIADEWKAMPVNKYYYEVTELINNEMKRISQQYELAADDTSRTKHVDKKVWEALEKQYKENPNYFNFVNQALKERYHNITESRGISDSNFKKGKKEEAKLLPAIQVTDAIVKTYGADRANDDTYNVYVKNFKETDYIGLVRAVCYYSLEGPNRSDRIIKEGAAISRCVTKEQAEEIARAIASHGAEAVIEQAKTYNDRPTKNVKCNITK